MYKKTFRDPSITQQLLMQSRIEADSLNERDIVCPACGFRVQQVFSDAIGHLKIKCPKCKGIFILNLAYFRKVKNRDRYRHRIFNSYSYNK